MVEMEDPLQWGGGRSDADHSVGESGPSSPPTDPQHTGSMTSDTGTAGSMASDTGTATASAGQRPTRLFEEGHGGSRTPPSTLGRDSHGSDVQNSSHSSSTSSREENEGSMGMTGSEDSRGSANDPAGSQPAQKSGNISSKSRSNSSSGSGSSSSPPSKKAQSTSKSGSGSPPPQKAQKGPAKKEKVKEMFFSPKIAPHDIEHRLKRARQWLTDGLK